MLSTYLLLLLEAMHVCTKTVGKGWHLIICTSQATTINFNLKLMNSKHKIKLTTSYRQDTFHPMYLLYTTNFC